MPTHNPDTEIPLMAVVPKQVPAETTNTAAAAVYNSIWFLVSALNSVPGRTAQDKVDIMKYDKGGLAAAQALLAHTSAKEAANKICSATSYEGVLSWPAAAPITAWVKQLVHVDVHDTKNLIAHTDPSIVAALRAAKEHGFVAVRCTRSAWGTQVLQARWFVLGLHVPTDTVYVMDPTSPKRLTTTTACAGIVLGYYYRRYEIEGEAFLQTAMHSYPQSLCEEVQRLVGS